MKKIFNYFAASVLALSACTSESVIDDAVKDSNAINFKTVVNKPSKAADLTTATLDHFSVFGYYTLPGDEETASTIFYDVPVTTTNSVDWTYTGEKRYWIPGAKYYFFAYNCGNVAKLDSSFGSFDMNTDDKMLPSDRILKITNYVCDNTHQHDLIFASNTGDNYGGIEGKEGNNSTVAFTFKHLLSKVKFNLKSTFPTEYTVLVENVAIRDVRNTGCYSPISTDPKWYQVTRGLLDNEHPYIEMGKTSTSIEEGQPVTVNIPLQTTNTGTATNPGIDTDYAYVLPFDYTAKAEDVWVYFDLTVYNKGQEVFTKKGMNGKFSPVWNPGYAYTYNIDLNGEAANLNTIEFTLTTIEPWADEAADENNNSNHDVTITK